MKVITVLSSLFLIFLTFVSITSHYITCTYFTSFLNITLIIIISLIILTSPKENLQFYQKSFIFLSPLLLLIPNGNFKNIYLICAILILHIIVITKFKFRVYELLIEFLIIIFLIILLILSSLLYDFKNQTEDLILFSEDKENILKGSFLDEGGLGASEYLILIKNYNHLMKQEIELCYNVHINKFEWINEDKIKIDQSILDIKNIPLVLKRPEFGKCIDY